MKRLGMILALTLGACVPHWSTTSDIAYKSGQHGRILHTVCKRHQVYGHVCTVSYTTLFPPTSDPMCECYSKGSRLSSEVHCTCTIWEDVD